MRRSFATLVAFCLFVPASGCEQGVGGAPATSAPETVGAREAAPEPEAEARFGPVPADWVRARVDESEARLSATPVGILVLGAIEAHGGLEAWLEQGTIEFEFDYQPLAQPERRMHTFSRVDLFRSRAHQQELGEGADATLAFDGERAWVAPGPEAFPSPPRFWATTPYYFVGIPFVMGDPGARFEQLEDAELDGVVHHLVRVTYAAGTGDSPDDYYILYLHPDTHRVSALRYVVAYPGFFPEGGHSPEKIMLLSELHDVQGLTFAGRLDTYRFDAETETKGEVVTEIRVSRIRLGETYSTEIFDPPDGATVRTEIVGRE